MFWCLVAKKRQEKLVFFVSIFKIGKLIYFGFFYNLNDNMKILKIFVIILLVTFT